MLLVVVVSLCGQTYMVHKLFYYIFMALYAFRLLQFKALIISYQLHYESIGYTWFSMPQTQRRQVVKICKQNYLIVQLKINSELVSLRLILYTSGDFGIYCERYLVMNSAFICYRIKLGKCISISISEHLSFFFHFLFTTLHLTHWSFYQSFKSKRFAELIILWKKCPFVRNTLTFYSRKNLMDVGELIFTYFIIRFANLVKLAGILEQN